MRSIWIQRSASNGGTPPGCLTGRQARLGRDTPHAGAPPPGSQRGPQPALPYRAQHPTGRTTSSADRQAIQAVGDALGQRQIGHGRQERVVAPVTSCRGPYHRHSGCQDRVSAAQLRGELEDFAVGAALVSADQVRVDLDGGETGRARRRAAISAAAPQKRSPSSRACRHRSGEPLPDPASSHPVPPPRHPVRARTAR